MCLHGTICAYVSVFCYILYSNSTCRCSSCNLISHTVLILSDTVIRFCGCCSVDVFTTRCCTVVRSGHSRWYGTQLTFARTVGAILAV